MAERLYECMFLLDSGRFAQDRSGTEDAVKDLLGKCGGEILAAAPWQDGKLPYPIEGYKKGCHYLTYVKMDGSQVGELARLVKLSDLVLRHLVIDHTDHGALFHEKLIPTLQNHVAGTGQEEEPRQDYFMGGRGGGRGGRW
ncbi:MAG: 30S ribosomal protein S6 [Planctomycetaceae bacterium]|nr:30S ribosomal protein S6 [Planctomycetaceae bacterium]